MEPKGEPEDRRTDEGEMGGPPWRMMRGMGMGRRMGMGRGMGWRMGRVAGWRIALSIILFLGFLSFIIVWLFFFADGFSLAQNIAIFLLAVLIFGGIRAAVWAAMWMRRERRK
ncbi:MAG: hypothetical protein ACE5JE_01970 [Thermoplasmata archaeon]